MTDVIQTQATPTNSLHSPLVYAMGAVMLAGPLQYPMPVDAYEVHQVGGSYSASIHRPQTEQYSSMKFLQSMADIYSMLAERQETLGPEFETAIYEGIETLYEV